MGNMSLVVGIGTTVQRLTGVVASGHSGPFEHRCC